MAEQVILVCDVCGKPASSRVNFTVNTGGGRAAGQRFAKDLCATHLSELVANASKPRRGRRRATVAKSATPRRRGRPPKAKADATA